MVTHILVIEDNPDNLSLMVYLLDHFGYKTYSSVDGKEGVAMVSTLLPDLIICDIRLPGLTGFEIAQQLKSQAKLKHIPLVAVTANSMVGDRNTILEAGFDGYIPKPIDPETFVQEVEKFLKPEQLARKT